MPGKALELRFAFFEECVAALYCFFGGVCQAGRLASEELLTDETIIREVERVFQHALGGWALRGYFKAPLERNSFKVVVRHSLVYGTHLDHVVGRVIAPEEEYLSGTFLTDLPCEQRRAVTAIELTNVSVGLLEDCMFLRRQCEVADDMEGVAAADRPARYNPGLAGTA